MDFETRLARFSEHVDRRPRTNAEGLRAFLLHAQLYALGVLPERPPEDTYRALAGAYAPQASVAPYEQEQLGLLVESAWLLTGQVGQVEGLDDTALFGVLTPIPEGFPYRELLADGCVYTVEALRGCTEGQLEQITGIGPERVEDVLMALAALNAEPGTQLGASEGDPAGGEGGDPEYLNPAEPYSGPYAAELLTAQPPLTTNGDVFLASDDALIAVRGIAKGRVKEIRAHFERGS